VRQRENLFKKRKRRSHKKKKKIVKYRSTFQKGNIAVRRVTPSQRDFLCRKEMGLHQQGGLQRVKIAP